MYLISSSNNHGSLAEYICNFVLSIIIQWLFTKGKSNNLPWCSMPLDLTLDPLGCFYVRRILSGSSGCMISRIHEYMGIQLPRGITSSIYGVKTQGYKIVSCHRIRSPESNLSCYLLLFFVLRPAQDMEVILNPVNFIEHPVIETKKDKERRRIFTLDINI